MSKARQQALANHAVELMSGFADVQAKAMFGGFGLFLDGLMFALIIEDRLYFKVDDESEPLFAAIGDVKATDLCLLKRKTLLEEEREARDAIYVAFCKRNLLVVCSSNTIDGLRSHPPLPSGRKHAQLPRY